MAEAAKYTHAGYGDVHACRLTADLSNYSTTRRNRLAAGVAKEICRNNTHAALKIVCTTFIICLHVLCCLFCNLDSGGGAEQG